jgi:hypothetical protein
MKNYTLLFLLCLLFSCKENSTKLNEIQVIGSHNSYKIAFDKELWKYVYQQDSNLAKTLQYEHISIYDQLKLGLRSLEFDVFYDPEGGLFKNPKGLEITKRMGGTPKAFDQENKLSEPGLKVFHIQDVDFRSHNLLFVDCLKEVKRWSDDNPNHLPLFITINTKDQNAPQIRKVLKFNKEALNTVGAEIKTVLSDRLITPDMIRGNSKSLAESVEKKGWPTLNNMRGKIMFVLDESINRAKLYSKNPKLLEGKVMFVKNDDNNELKSPIHIINNPIKDFNKIKELVAKGHIVRTRADADCIEARTNSNERLNKAIESGAQIISTDYYIKGKLFKTNYEAKFPDGKYARIKKCN